MFSEFGHPIRRRRAVDVVGTSGSNLGSASSDILPGLVPDG